MNPIANAVHSTLGLSRQLVRPRLLDNCQPRLIRRAFVSAADLTFGQPLHETHPHLLDSGELTPGITALEYAERRAKLAEALPPNSLAILAAADVKYRSGTVFYKHHQEPNFLYLTGFNEPDALAVIEKTGSGASHRFHLYVRPKDSVQERWEGTRSGLQAAEDVFNADETGDVDRSLSRLSDLVGQSREIFTDIQADAKSKTTFTRIVFGSNSAGPYTLGKLLQDSTVKPLRPYLNELRIKKSNAEIRNMRKAGLASGRAFTEAMGQSWTYERDLDAFLDFKFNMNGCEESAYVPVVAGGENALQIHYVRNDAVLDPDALVTVDAGGEYGGYVTDITRAWPVNGKFTDAQKDLYEMVLRVQQTCIALCREDANISLDKLHGVAESRLKDGLKDLGFNMASNSLDALFPHHLGHYLGLAVHDGPGYPRTLPLKKNNVVTVEPGIYVENDERWPAHFRGMGIRIEDSVCVGESDPFVLTQEAIKEVRDIEAQRT